MGQPHWGCLVRFTLLYRPKYFSVCCFFSCHKNCIRLKDVSFTTKRNMCAPKAVMYHKNFLKREERWEFFREYISRMKMIISWHSFYGKFLGKCDFVQSNPCWWGNENLYLRQRKLLHGALSRIDFNWPTIREQPRIRSSRFISLQFPSLMDAFTLMTFYALLLRAICRQVYPINASLKILPTLSWINFMTIFSHRKHLRTLSLRYWLYFN